MKQQEWRCGEMSKRLTKTQQGSKIKCDWIGNKVRPRSKPLLQGDPSSFPSVSSEHQTSLARQCLSMSTSRPVWLSVLAAPHSTAGQSKAQHAGWWRVSFPCNASEFSPLSRDDEEPRPHRDQQLHHPHHFRECEACRNYKPGPDSAPMSPCLPV